MIRWEDLPAEMRTKEVRHYYNLLRKRPISLALKRAFDIVVSAFMLVCLSPMTPVPVLPALSVSPVPFRLRRPEYF